MDLGLVCFNLSIDSMSNADFFMLKQVYSDHHHHWMNHLNHIRATEYKERDRAIFNMLYFFSCCLNGLGQPFDT